MQPQQQDSPKSALSPKETGRSSFPFCGNEVDRLNWLLINVKVRRAHFSISTRLRTSAENATAILEWLSAKPELRLTTWPYWLQTEINFGSNFAGWLEAAVSTTGALHPSPFTQALQKVRAEIQIARTQQQEVRTELLGMLYTKRGRRGCIECGDESGILEFDHEDRATKTGHVSHYLGKCEWEKAKAEAAKCVVRCRGCHRTKSRRLMEGPPAWRLPYDAAKERKRADARKRSAVAVLQGQQRLRNAKLTAGECALCHKCCTPDSVNNFEFDHTDPSTKTANLGTIVCATDERFYKEYAKCRLLCTVCHYKCTMSQQESGLIAAIRHANKQKRKSAVANV